MLSILVSAKKNPPTSRAGTSPSFAEEPIIMATQTVNSIVSPRKSDAARNGCPR